MLRGKERESKCVSSGLSVGFLVSVLSLRRSVLSPRVRERALTNAAEGKRKSE